MRGVRLTHIGGPTLLIEYGGWRLLTDPTFDPPGRRYDFGWGTSSRKVSGPAVDPAGLGRVDAVLLTHDHHGDNLDHAGRDVLATAERVLTTAAGARRLAPLVGLRATGLTPWSTTTVEAPGHPTIEVTATPCRHGPPLSRPIVGDVIWFALRWSDQDTGRLWISGDTVLYDGVREVADRIEVDTAILHLGGVRFPVTGRLRYTMTARDAVEICRTLQPRTVIPVHYEGWTHFRQDRHAAEQEFARGPGALRERIHWLPPGVPTELVP
jgi:L-ascorbate metabolism protein UlaG (beta-lactamase superfamily)